MLATGAFYFGEFNDNPLAPFNVSVASFDNSFLGESKHYHTHNQKVYIVFSGKGVLNVNGAQVEMSPETMIHIEPNDVHYLEKVLEAPLEFVVVLSSKIDDRVVIE